MFHVALHTRITELTSNKTLGIEHSVGSVHGSLGLGGISNKTLSLSEGDVRRGGAVSLIVGNDLDTVVLPHADAGVGGSKVDSDTFSGNLSHGCCLICW